MTPITKRRRLRLLALAKPNFFCFVKLHFHTFKRSAFYLFMIAVAERRLFGKTAAAPGIYFAGLYHDANRFTKYRAGKSYIGKCLFHKLFISDEFIKIETAF